MAVRAGFFLFAALTVLLSGRSAVAGPVPVPPDLPKYDLRITLDVAGHTATFCQTVTWTNRTTRPAENIVFNFYPLYQVPSGEKLLMAKTLELLRMIPSDAIDFGGHHGRIDSICLGQAEGQSLAYRAQADNPTGLIVDLPKPVPPNGTVTVTVTGSVHLPTKQGRWGQWGGITFLTNAMPTVAYYDDRGWHAMPFVPWHQPFYNEAGVYSAVVTVPSDQVVACSATAASEIASADGWNKVIFRPFIGRDFAVLCSAGYQCQTETVHCPDGRDIKLKCLSHGKHAPYAKEMLKIAAAAIPEYVKWFGPFPYDEFTIVESYFGWNGNECAGLIMIDERVFDMPNLARGYVEYLVSHETCHQWWYNQVGTNGYAETFMDEGMATYFTHRLLDRTRGKDNAFLEWPFKITWLPNINRENYRYSSLYGAIRRDDAPAAAGTLAEFGNLARLFSGAYDRGSKAFGMIEARLGEAAFLDFIRTVVKKYSFRVFHAADLQAELIAYNGPASADYWESFFKRWIYGTGLTDWRIDSVHVADDGPRLRRRSPDSGPVRVEVICSQHREFDEPTTLGFQFADGDGFPVRVPIGPCSLGRSCPEVDAEVVPAGPGKCRVTITLPSKPTQIAIDPDNVLLDANPADNRWGRSPNIRILPLYSFLYDTDLTTDYDRWNFSIGPWFYGAMYQDPWYTRSTLFGVRAGAYRTQTFSGGGYVAARTDTRDLVVGADAVLDHFPFPKTSIGFNYERRIAGPWFDTGGRNGTNRGVIWSRYTLQYGSSLYLPPFSYIDLFADYQDNFLPYARTTTPDGIRPGWTQMNGLHYRLNLYTPYWDPEMGVWVDLVAAGGTVDVGNKVGNAELRAELAHVRRLPEGLGYLSGVKVAARAVVQGNTKEDGLFLPLGGSTLFRGFDLAERQGSFLWAANTELRFPLGVDLRLNALDSIAGVRNISGAAFYDVGNVYVNRKSVGGAAHALGVGLRVDLAIFSFIERATIRIDAAKTINAATPTQLWFGVQQPF